MVRALATIRSRPRAAGALAGGALLALLWPTTPAAGQTFVVTDGRICTLDPARPFVEALAVEDGRIRGFGSESDCLALLGGRAPRVRLYGGFLLPGLRDAGVFVGRLGRLLTGEAVDLRAHRTASGVLERLREAAAEAPSARWVVGFGLDLALLDPEDGITRDLLDLATDPIPSVAVSHQGLAAVASTAALQLAGVTDETPDPPGGFIERDRWGDPTGRLFGGAVTWLLAHEPVPPFDERLEMLRRALERLVREGITAVVDLSDPRWWIEPYTALAAEGSASPRVELCPPAEVLDEALARRLSRLPRRAPERFRFERARVVVDGEPVTHTAWLVRPYADDALSIGRSFLDPAELLPSLRARPERWRVRAFGDRAMRRAAEILGRAAEFETPYLMPKEQGVPEAVVLVPRSALLRNGRALAVALGAERAGRLARTVPAARSRRVSLASMAPDAPPDPAADAASLLERWGEEAGWRAIGALCIPLRVGAPADLVAFAPGDPLRPETWRLRWTRIDGRLVHGSE